MNLTRPAALGLFVILLCASAFAQSPAPSQEEKERAFVVFTRVLKSESEARTHVGFLIVHEERSPWRFSTLVDLTLRLAVAGNSTTDIDGALTPCGDMASALSTEPADAQFADIVLLIFELNGDSVDVLWALSRLESAGVPAYQLIAEMTGMSAKKVKGLANEGRLRGPVIKKILLEAFKRKYAGLGAKLAENKRSR